MRTINLIPQEGKQVSDARNRVAMYLVLGLVYVALLAAITVWRQGSVTSAEDELNDQLARNQELQLEVNSLAGAENVRNELDESSALLAVALINDVSWGRLINDLGRLIPDRVWISNYSGTVAPIVPGSPSVGVGELTVTGTAFGPTDVAAWLRIVDSDRYPGLLGTWASTITASEIGEAEVVTFGSTSNLTEDALSGRLFERIPELS